MSRDLRALLERILARQHVPFAEAGEHAVTFPYEGAHGALRVTAHLVDDRVVDFRATLPVPVPEEALGRVGSWILQANDGLRLGGFVLDVEQGVVSFRRSVDTLHMSDELLGQVLPETWRHCAETMDARAPEIVGLCAAAVDDPDEEAEARAAGEIEEQVDSLRHAMDGVLAKSCGPGLAPMIGGTLRDLARAFVARLGEAGLVDQEVKIRLTGHEDAMVLALATRGVAPLKLRFSPTAIRERAARDAEGLVLHHHATVEEAEAIASRGFADARHEVREFINTADGSPVVASRVVLEGVLLSSEPLPPDDRRGRPRLVRVEWGADAPPLGEFEHVRTRYSESEAVLELPEVRRWFVPARVLNAAVRAGVARVTIGG